MLILIFCWAQDQGPIPFKIRPIRPKPNSEYPDLLSSPTSQLRQNLRPKPPGPNLPKGHRPNVTQTCMLAYSPVSKPNRPGCCFLLPRAPKASTPTCMASSPGFPFPMRTGHHGHPKPCSWQCSMLACPRSRQATWPDTATSTPRCAITKPYLPNILQPTNDHASAQLHHLLQHVTRQSTLSPCQPSELLSSYHLQASFSPTRNRR